MKCGLRGPNLDEPFNGQLELRGPRGKRGKGCFNELASKIDKLEGRLPRRKHENIPREYRAPSLRISHFRVEINRGHDSRPELAVSASAKNIRSRLAWK
jgi:hypothetical protein